MVRKPMRTAISHPSLQVENLAEKAPLHALANKLVSDVSRTSKHLVCKGPDGSGGHLQPLKLSTASTFSH